MKQIAEEILGDQLKMGCIHKQFEENFTEYLCYSNF